MSDLDRPTASAPPLAFALFWLAFTAVHCFFMLRGAWGSGVMFFLVPFYALFFGVGFWMLRLWWGTRTLRQRYGSPTLQSLPPVGLGQLLQVAVEFDRAWAREAALAGSYCWVEVLPKGSSGRTLAESPVHGGAGPGARGSTWQGSGMVPMRPANAARLELLLQPAGARPGSGWRFPLPVQVEGVAGGEAAALQMTPAQGRQLERVLGWITIALLGVGSWQLFETLESGRRALFPLVFPGAFLLGAWILHDLRAALLGIVARGSVDPDQVKALMQPFVQGLRTRVQVFFTLAVAAFFVDMFDWLKFL